MTGVREIQVSIECVDAPELHREILLNVHEAAFRGWMTKRSPDEIRERICAIDGVTSCTFTPVSETR